MTEDRPPVRGEVRAGFEPLEDAFVENFRERGELGAACAVYHRGEKVVDLWGGYRDEERTKPWEEDTLVLVFSTTKALSSVAMALARSRGHFSYDDRVSDHWPEFGRNGKADVSVRELLGHRAGVAAIDATLTPESIADRDSLMELLAAKRPDWEPGTRHGYHAFSLGWYASELLRRTDPEQRPLGRFFAEEVADPMDVEFYIGLPDEVDEERLASIRGFSPLSMLRNARSVPWRMVLALMNPRSVTSRAMAPFDIRSPAQLNEPGYRRVEIPAGNGIGSVRDVAKVLGSLAVGGDEVGVDAGTVDELAAYPAPPRGGSMDVVLKMETAYNLGFWKPNDGFAFGSPRAFGAPGAGGSFAFADPDRDLGFAYAPNRMGTYVVSDPRERTLRDAAIDCADRR